MSSFSWMMARRTVWLDRAWRSGSRGRLLRRRKNAGRERRDARWMKTAIASVIVLLDGDLQNDPVDIPKPLGEIQSRG